MLRLRRRGGAVEDGTAHGEAVRFPRRCATGAAADSKKQMFLPYVKLLGYAAQKMKFVNITDKGLIYINRMKIKSPGGKMDEHL